jgi:hypothetical protein
MHFLQFEYYSSLLIADIQIYCLSLPREYGFVQVMFVELSGTDAKVKVHKFFGKFRDDDGILERAAAMLAHTRGYC